MPDKNKKPAKDDKSGDSKSPPRILVWIAFLVILPLVLLILHNEKRNTQREQLTHSQLFHLVTNIHLVVKGTVTHDPQYEDLKRITGVRKAGTWNSDGTFASDDTSQQEVGFWMKSPILPVSTKPC